VIAYDRRKILHFNVTEHPTGPWIVEQLREAFPEDRAPKYLILDPDAKLGRAYPKSVRRLQPS
jgi:putative transposase